jgi:hypothetical protein
MKTPEALSEWLLDVQGAYDTATRLIGSDACTLQHLTELYKLAAPIAAANRGVDAQETIDTMTRHIVERVDSEIKHGESLSAFQFHFVYSYIHAHTPTGLIDEFKADEVMGYVNDHWNLFREQA